MNRNLFNRKGIIAGLMALSIFTSCESDDETLRKPDSIEITTPNGSSSIFPSETLEFVGEVSDADFVNWYLGDAHMSDSSSFTYTFNEVGDFRALFSAGYTGADSLTAYRDITVNPFNGFMVLSEGSFGAPGSESFTFVNTDRELKINGVFNAQNDGAEVGSTLQSAVVSDNYIYAVAQNGPNLVSIINKEDLTLEQGLTSSELNFGEYIYPTNITLVDDAKAYVRSFYYDDFYATHSAVFALDLTTNTLSKVDGVHANLGQMQIVGDELFTIEGDVLYITNVTSNTLTETVALESVATTMVKDSQDNLVVVLTGENSKVVKINAASRNITETIDAPEGVSFASGSKNAYTTINPSTDAVYFIPYTAGDWGGTITNKMYEVKDGALKEAFDISNWSDDEAGFPYGEIAFDEATGNLMITTIKSYGEYDSNALFFVDPSTGSVVKKYAGVGEFPAMVLPL
ncbi:DUF5074 domain-containing protein [Sediminitomix flava]|uniref:PKD family protein n=1 Tax=Sediminitomix flava TaxID=379075 RepID=A0A315Z9I2_SEDFL|nr:DUF5074 domain-containing protein [Sediminitomix flava]PWJ42216.1 hypothetical protein BC781_103468 [Sediminitomix flava]